MFFISDILTSLLIHESTICLLTGGASKIQTSAPLRAKYFGFQFCHGWFLFSTPSATQFMYEICSVGPSSPLLNSAAWNIKMKDKPKIKIRMQKWENNGFLCHCPLIEIIN